MLHSMLNRQLRKIGLSPDEAPTPELWAQFLERVNRSYIESDQERYTLERSLTIFSEEMKQVYEKLCKSETRYALAAQGANDGLWDWDLINEEIYYSARWLEIVGIVPQEGQKPCRSCWLDRVHPDDRPAVEAALDAHLDGRTRHFQNEHRILIEEDQYRWVLIRGLAVRDENGKAYRIAGSLTDITERKDTEEKLEHAAIHDTLTGLPNRKCLMDRLERSLERAQLNDGYGFAALFIDLDRFKIVNDSMGHQAGDELLLKVTQRISHAIRPSDMVARLGGDEFVVLLDKLREKSQVAPIAERLQHEIQQPILIEGQEVFTSASIGVVMGTSKYAKAEDLIRDADIAMYRAKMKGKARFELFDEEMHVGAVSLLQLESDLRRALDRQEFILHYQPIVSLDSDTIIGFESLVRWMHPTRGMVPPNDFIPVAEETGVIIPLGIWVMREACRQMRAWQLEFPTPTPLVINVNLSARQLEQKDLLEQIALILEETGLDPSCLKLEITESVIMHNAEQAVATVKQMREMGIQVSIDDFGTGYSSLSYLHRFPIDTLKVDRSFINRIGSDGENSEIIQTIILLAANLGIDVVAEGVETAEQLNFLRQIKCTYGQGYFYSRPVNPNDATAMIRELIETNHAVATQAALSAPALVTA